LPGLNINFKISITQKIHSSTWRCNHRWQHFAINIKRWEEVRKHHTVAFIKGNIRYEEDGPLGTPHNLYTSLQCRAHEKYTTKFWDKIFLKMGGTLVILALWRKQTPNTGNIQNHRPQFLHDKRFASLQLQPFQAEQNLDERSTTMTLAVRGTEALSAIAWEENLLRKNESGKKARLHALTCLSCTTGLLWLYEKTHLELMLLCLLHWLCAMSRLPVNSKVSTIISEII
jgi:hypothetical protein